MKFENFNENLIYKYKRYVWFIIWILFFRFSPFFLYGWRNFILKIFGAQIGKNVHIYPSCKIYSPWNLIMLDNSTLGRDVDCYSYAKIKIGRNSAVSQRSFLCAASRNYKKKNRPIIVAEIEIGDNCWVAAESFIAPGVKIANDSVVLARSVLTKSFEPGSLIAGHPAKKIKSIKFD